MILEHFIAMSPKRMRSGRSRAPRKVKKAGKRKGKRGRRGRRGRRGGVLGRRVRTFGSSINKAFIRRIPAYV